VIFPFNGGLREGRNGMEGGQREEELGLAYSIPCETMKAPQRRYQPKRRFLQRFT
jgi:hypothetical protein